MRKPFTSHILSVVVVIVYKAFSVLGSTLNTIIQRDTMITVMRGYE